MSSYTTLAAYASEFSWLPAELAETCYGEHVADAHRVAKSGTSWSILECGEYREASPNEVAGIEKSLVEMAEALAHFCDCDEIDAYAQVIECIPGYAEALDEIDAMILANEADWLDMIDTQASIRFGFQMF